MVEIVPFFPSSLAEKQIEAASRQAWHVQDRQDERARVSVKLGFDESDKHVQKESYPWGAEKGTSRENCW